MGANALIASVVGLTAPLFGNGGRINGVIRNLSQKSAREVQIAREVPRLRRSSMATDASRWQAARERYSGGDRSEEAAIRAAWAGDLEATAWVACHIPKLRAEAMAALRNAVANNKAGAQVYLIWAVGSAAPAAACILAIALLARQSPTSPERQAALRLTESMLTVVQAGPVPRNLEPYGRLSGGVRQTTRPTHTRTRPRARACPHARPHAHRLLAHPARPLQSLL